MLITTFAFAVLAGFGTAGFMAAEGKRRRTMAILLLVLWCVATYLIARILLPVTIELYRGRREALRASKIMADRALAHEKIEMVWDSVVEEVVGDGTLG